MVSGTSQGGYSGLSGGCVYPAHSEIRRLNHPPQGMMITGVIDVLVVGVPLINILGTTPMRDL